MNSKALKLNRGKFCIIGSEAQVAATESNGGKALVVQQVKTKRDAGQWLNRSNSALACVSGRLGRWLTPTFTVVETAEINRRMEAV